MSAEKTLSKENTIQQTSSSIRNRSHSSSQVQRRRIMNYLFHSLFLLATLVGIAVLAILLIDIVKRGWDWLTPEFFENFASRLPSRAGFKAAIWGSLWMIGVTAPLTFILGVSTAIYLEEYSKKNWLSRFIQLNISNLAGVPSIVYGILGLTLFVRVLGLGSSVLAGSLTMTLLVLPIVIVASRESIASVPSVLKQASYAMGASRWQTIRHVVLPYSLPGILTGTILALSRAIGETAPLIMVGAVTFLAFTPENVLSQFTVMPIQIYQWIGLPRIEFQQLAAAGIIVLLIVLLTMNAIAILLRNKFQR
jgi:phosphate transport system permease protein